MHSQSDNSVFGVNLWKHYLRTIIWIHCTASGLNYKNVIAFSFNVLQHSVELGFRENKLTIIFSSLGVTLPTEPRSGKVIDSFCCFTGKSFHPLTNEWLVGFLMYEYSAAVAYDISRPFGGGGGGGEGGTLLQSVTRT